MANKKITQLPVNTNPSNTGVLPIVEAGVTDQTTAQNLITKAHGITPGATVLTDGLGVMTGVVNGSAGEVLTADGTGSASYQAIPTPTYTADSTLVTDGAGNVTTVANGGAGEVLTADGLGGVSYQTPAPGGQIIYDAIVPDNYATLTDALAAASNGWNIFIRPGTYVEAGFTSYRSNISVYGSGTFNTVLDFTASNGNFDWSNAGTGWNLFNFKINLSTGSFNTGGMYSNVQNIYIYQAGIIAGVQAFGIGTVYGKYTNVTFQNAGIGPDTALRAQVSNGPNTFTSCKFVAHLDGLTAGNSAITIPSASNIIFNDCLFWGTGGTGLGSNLFFHNNGNNLTLNNCNFYNGAGETNDYALYDNNADNTRIIGCKFDGFGFGIYAQTSTSSTITNNIINSTTTTGIGIDIDFGVGSVINDNTIKVGTGGTSTGIRLWNGGSNHTVTGNAVNAADTGIYVEAGVTDAILSSNSLFGATLDIDDNGTGTVIINGAGGGGQSTYNAIVAATGGTHTTLGAALAAASNGWRIFIADGTYTESAISSALNGITIEGSGIDASNSILNFGSNAFDWSGNNWIFKNLKMQFTDGYWNPSGNNHLVENISITGSAAPTALGHGIIVTQNSVFNKVEYTETNTSSSANYKFRIQGNKNEFNDCLFAGCMLGSTSGIFLVSSNKTIFVGCRFTTTTTDTGVFIVRGDSADLTFSSCQWDSAATGGSNSDTGMLATNGGLNVNNCYFDNIRTALLLASDADIASVITGNRFTSFSANGKLVELNGGKNYIISNNQFYQSSSSSTHGIFLGFDCDKNTITSNNIRSAGTAITVSSATDNDNLIVGNTLIASATKIADSGTNTLSASNQI